MASSCSKLGKKIINIKKKRKKKKVINIWTAFFYLCVLNCGDPSAAIIGWGKENMIREGHKIQILSTCKRIRVDYFRSYEI